MRNSAGLVNRINRAFLLQAALISIAAMLSVFFAKVVIEEILIKSAIEEEAGYFWENHQRDAAFPLPDTLNLTGFLSIDLLPAIVRQNMPEQTGFYEYEDAGNKLVLYVSENNNRRLYLLYNRGQVDSLAAYYGLFPLAVVLIVLYLSLWATYRFSRRMVSPVSLLARQVNDMDFTSTDFSRTRTRQFPFNVNNDVQVLSDAIANLGKRLEDFITRERNFTRDASHELRSPLTVINIATDMLMSEPGLTDGAQRNLQRIKRATNDMEELIEAFLLLARESGESRTGEIVSVNDVIDEEIDRLQIINDTKRLNINYTASQTLKVRASDKVLSVLFGNLLRNAVLYTDNGNVDVMLDGNSVVIQDSGRGMPQQEVDNIFKPFYRGGENDAVGYGVGLTIVKRLSDRFDWPVSITSSPGEGTRVVVRFPPEAS